MLFFSSRQQELFAKAREEQAAAEHAQWLQLQAEAQITLQQQQQQQGEVPANNEDGDYSWCNISACNFELIQCWIHSQSSLS